MDLEVISKKIGNDGRAAILSVMVGHSLMTKKAKHFRKHCPVVLPG